MAICIIPARGGSRRIPHKNIKPFHGIPIIAYSINAARESGLFSKIIVSTDSDAIEQVALSAGARVWRRKAKYGKDEVGTQEVVKECVDGMGVPHMEDVCCLYATAPLLSVKDLIKGYQLLTNYGALYAMSVGYPPLQDAGQFYWGKAISFVVRRPLIGEHTRMVLVDPSRLCDINTMGDWNQALKMYEELKNA